MDAEAVEAARRDLANTACYLAVMAEPTLITVQGMRDLARQIRIVTAAYDRVVCALATALAHLADEPPQDLL
jgi:hypothetical protein